jgi:Arc/MetJ-type ribon-helix-helix transcriptional regulator
MKTHKVTLSAGASVWVNGEVADGRYPSAESMISSALGQFEFNLEYLGDIKWFETHGCQPQEALPDDLFRAEPEEGDDNHDGDREGTLMTIRLVAQVVTPADIERMAGGAGTQFDEIQGKTETLELIVRPDIGLFMDEAVAAGLFISTDALVEMALRDLRGELAHMDEMNTIDGVTYRMRTDADLDAFLAAIIRRADADFQKGNYIEFHDTDDLKVFLDEDLAEIVRRGGGKVVKAPMSDCIEFGGDPGIDVLLNGNGRGPVGPEIPVKASRNRE